MGTERLGGDVSSLIVPLVEAVFPAMSETTAVKLVVPSAEALNEEPPPLILAVPKMPEVTSVAEAEAVTDPDTNHPFNPSAGGMDRVRVGARLSTIIAAEAIVDVSPHEESAQKLRLVVPSGKVQEQADPLHSMPVLPSIPVMLYPPSGSFPDRLRVAIPLHQPLLPGTVHPVVPLTVAGGYVLVLVVWVQPVSPLEQLWVFPASSAMLQDRPAPQIPGQDVPQAVGALLK
jgi:hypothetical protein